MIYRRVYWYRLLYILLLGQLVWVVSGTISAQTTGTGTISGTVSDASGASVAHVRITLLQTATGLTRVATTNDQGFYVVPALRAGEYHLRAEASGFQLFEQTAIILTSDSTLTLNVRLEVGKLSQTTIVTAAPPAIDLSNGGINTLVSGTQLSQIALNGQNFTAFLTLGPGVTSSQTGYRMGVGQEGNPLMSVNGGRINSNAFTYDGILAMDTGGNRGLDLFPPTEAIQEIQIHKSNFTADIGSYGYSLVNIVTRSGGDTYHGDIYEIFANDALNSRNYFSTAKPPLRDNNFGYDLGGRVFPRSNSPFKKGLFFFWSEAWDKRSGPELVSFTSPPQSTFTATTPDAELRSGNFQELPVSIINPATGLPFADNIIPQNDINPNATLLLNDYYPLPNRSGSTNYSVSPNSQTSWREELIRVDSTLGDHDSLMGRYAHDAWSQDQAILQPSNQAFPTIGGYFAKPGQNAVLQWTHIFTGSTINQAAAGFSRNAITQIPDSSAKRPAGLTIPSLYNANTYDVIPTITLSGYSSIGAQGLTNNVNNVYTWRDDFTKQVHTHTLKTGVNILRIQKFSYSPYSGQAGTFSFTGSATGNAVADFLLGTAYSYAEQSYVPTLYQFSNMYEWYVQDDWKVRPNLTINLGLRDTIFQGAPDGYDKYNNISDFVPSLYNPADAPSITASGTIVAGTGDPLNGIITPTNQKGLHLPRSLTPARSNLGPRIGFAWSPSESAKTSIRGGYGILTHWDNDDQESLGENPPFSQSATIYNTTLNGFPSGTQTKFPPTLYAFNTTKLYPMIQQWSLTVEHQLPFSTVLSVSYVGNTAVHLDQTPNINQIQPNVAVAQGTVNVNTIRPYLGYAAINYDNRSASANYNGLQTEARHQFHNGLLFQVAYTYSKALGIQVGQDQFVNERGPTAYDRTHVLTLNYVYQLPFYRGEQGLPAAILGGWEVSGISTFESGLPTTATISTDRAGVGNTGQRPDVVGPIKTHPGNVNAYFDTSAFALPALGTFGNEGLDVIRLPGIDLTNFTLVKNQNFHFFGQKPVNARFEAEFFNIFNHPSFNALGTTFGSPAFGTITSALDPRNVAFKLKFSF